MTSRTPSRILQGISALQGDYLDQEDPVFSADPMRAAGLGLVHVEGLTRFWESGGTGQGGLGLRQAQLLAGLYNPALPWGMTILGEPQGIAVHLALTGGVAALQGWQELLSSVFPGCTLSAGPEAQHVLDIFRSFPAIASLTGNPSAGEAEPDVQMPLLRLEPLVGAMAGTHWAYLVLARPVSPREIQEMDQDLAREEQEIRSAYLRPGTAEENNNPQAQHYVSLLQAARQRMEAGQQSGMWNVQAYLMAQNDQALERGGQALAGSFAGRDSLPQPFRVRSCRLDSARAGFRPPATLLTTAEAAALSQLPSQESPGYALREMVSFSVSPPSASRGSTVAIGNIMNGGARTGNWFEVRLEDLAKHVFVAGVTGSGKTRTCQYLLSQLWDEHRIPWLVVEPSTKSEYRRLAAATSLGGDLQIYTPGDETCAPLRLNPLQVLRGVSVQTHIDALCSLFSASFAMVTPMPEVLNEALHRVYTDRGWNLIRGTNPLGYVPEAQPVISDLISTLERLIPALGYNAEVTGNLQAGLLTRVRALTLGGKGALLNSGLSTDIEGLLEKPTVLELSAIGDDDSKAFVMASLLLHLSEYRQSGGLSNGQLRHVTLIEEAHRLLRTAPETIASEYANPRAKAVEALCQLLVEMRAYGEGLVVVDQVPAKLAPDAIKNTNLKIIHRLVAGDDRDLVGRTMNLTAPQERHLAALPSGQAVVYAEGRDASYLVQIPDHAGRHGYGNAAITNAEVKRLMHGKIVPLPEHSQSAQARHQLPRCQGCRQQGCEAYRIIARQLLSRDYSKQFAHAVQEGAESIWAFGTMVATDIWGGATKPEVPYCVVLALLSLAGYEPAIIENMRRQLEPILIRIRRNGA